MTTCDICGRKLKDPLSIERKRGKVCQKKVDAELGGDSLFEGLDNHIESVPLPFELCL